MNGRTRKCLKVTLNLCYNFIIQQLKSFYSHVAKPILPIVNPEMFTIARFFLIEMYSHRILEYVELFWHHQNFGQLF